MGQERAKGYQRQLYSNVNRCTVCVVADNYDGTHEWQRAMVDAAAQAGSTCGLYLDQIGLARPADGTVLLMTVYTVGDLAFTDRSLHPAKEPVNREIREREVDAALDAFNAVRDRLLRGEGPIGDLEDEGDG